MRGPWKAVASRYPKFAVVFQFSATPRGTVLRSFLAPRLFDIQNCVKSGVMENIVYMIVYINNFEPATSPDESFLGFQQNAESRAGNILQLRKIERLLVSDGIHEGLGLFALRRVETPAAHNFAVITKVDLKHYALSPFVKVTVLHLSA